MNPKKCPECGDEMQPENIPDIVLDFSVFGYSIQIWNFNNKEDICVFCQTENDQMDEREAYEHGCEDGYIEAVNKYRKEY